MEKDKKYVYKGYLAHQYEKEELFLSKMAREGWHFVKIHHAILTKYEFVKGKPIDYVYQLDYVAKEEDTEDYHQLFQDAGWEEIFTWDGVYDGKWYYFRRIRTEGAELRIYTDNESKYRMYNKLWKMYGLFYAVLLCLEYGSFKSSFNQLAKSDFPSITSILLLALCGLIIILTVVGTQIIIGILFKMFKLKLKLNKKL